MVWWAPLLAGAAGAQQERQQGGSGQGALLSAGLNAVAPGAGAVLGGAQAARAGNPLPLISTGLGAAGLDTASSAVGAAGNPVGALAGVAGEALTGPGEAPTTSSGAPASFQQEKGSPSGTGWYTYADGARKYVAGQAASQLHDQLVGGGKVAETPQQGGQAPQKPSTPQAAGTAAAMVSELPDMQEGQTPEEQALLDLQGQQEQAAARRVDAQQAAQVQQAERTGELLREREAQADADKIAGAKQARDAQEDATWARQKIKEVSDEKIDTLRLWNDSGFFGKAISALMLLTAKPHNLRILMPFVGGLIQGDIQAQKFDKSSKLTAYRDLLGDSRAAEKAGELKRLESLRDGFETRLKGIQNDGMKQGGAAVTAALEEQILAKRQELLSDTFENRQKQRAQSQLESFREEQLSQGRQRLALDRERLSLRQKAAQGAPSAKAMLDEIEARAGIEQYRKTGRTPRQQQQVDAGAEKLGKQLEPYNQVQTALDRVIAATGAVENKQGELEFPDDILGVGELDTILAKGVPIPGTSWVLPGTGGLANKAMSDETRDVLSAIDFAVEKFGRQQSGAVIGDDERAAFEQMISGGATNEAEFKSRINSIYRNYKQNMQKVMQGFPPAAVQQYRDNIPSVQEGDQTGVRPVPRTEQVPTGQGPTGALSPRERSAELYRQMYG